MRLYPFIMKSLWGPAYILIPVSIKAVFKIQTLSWTLTVMLSEGIERCTAGFSCAVLWDKWKLCLYTRTENILSGIMKETCSPRREPIAQKPEPGHAPHFCVRTCRANWVILLGPWHPRHILGTLSHETAVRLFWPFTTDYCKAMHHWHEHAKWLCTACHPPPLPLSHCQSSLFNSISSLSDGEQ